MRKLMFAGLAVVMLSGIAYAQTNGRPPFVHPPDVWSAEQVREALKLLGRLPDATNQTERDKFLRQAQGPQCAMFDGTPRPVDSLVQHEGRTYRCSYVYDEWMTRTRQVVWVPATP